MHVMLIVYDTQCVLQLLQIDIRCNMKLRECGTFPEQTSSSL